MSLFIRLFAFFVLILSLSKVIGLLIYPSNSSDSVLKTTTIIGLTAILLATISFFLLDKGIIKYKK